MRKRAIWQSRSTAAVIPAVLAKTLSVSAEVSRPAVSITRNRMSPSFATPSRTSRVTWPSGVLYTSASRLFVNLSLIQALHQPVVVHWKSEKHQTSKEKSHYNAGNNYIHVCIWIYEAFWVDVNFKPGTHSLHIKFDHLPVEEGRLAHIGSAHKHNLRECVDRRLQKPLQRALPSSTYMGDLAHLAHHLSPNAQNCFTLSVFSPHFRDKKKHLLVTLLPSFLSSLQSLILSHSTLVHAAISQHLSFSSWSSPATIIYEVVGIECVAIAKPLRWGPIIPCFRTSQELKP